MEPISAVAITVGKEVTKEIAKELVKQVSKEITKEVGKTVKKEVVHSASDGLAEESDTPVLRGATRTVGGLGKTVSGVSNFDGNERLLDSTKLGRSLEKAGVERPLGTQAHHVIPSEVLEKHPLGKVCVDKLGKEYFDKAENGIFLPSIAEAKLDPRLSNLPIHRGPHPNYTERIQRQMDKMQNALEKRYGDLDSVPTDVLDKQLYKLQTNLKTSIENDLSLRKGDRLC